MSHCRAGLGFFIDAQGQKGSGAVLVLFQDPSIVNPGLITI